MRKIIIIGECTLDIIFPESTPTDSVEVRALPGGRLPNTAMLLGDHGHDVTFVGEAARDRIGDFLLQAFNRHNVTTKSIDRFSGGATATNVRFPADGDKATVCLRDYPQERFDVIWPRIDPDDIVIFGTHFAIDDRVRSQLVDLLNHAAERNAIIVYLPGFLPQQAPRLTRVMPTILENLELAQIVIVRPSDIATIFNSDESMAKAYHRHIEFYSPTMLSIDMENSALSLFHRQTAADRHIEMYDASLHGASAAIAGFVEALIELGVTHDSLDSLSASRVDEIASEAARRATKF